MRIAGLLVLTLSLPAMADEFKVRRFERQQLTDVYYSEGVNVGDIDGDGHVDVVHGPYWFQGPSFEAKHEIYPAKAQPRERYADNFFCWVRDFNGDQRQDVLVVGFPGTPAFVYENPGPGGYSNLWKKHTVIDQVSNESPQFVDITGDEQPELVCTRDGHYGWWEYRKDRGTLPWEFKPLSEKVAPKPFGHGLGVGDINGDGKLDVLASNGWFQHPEVSDQLWEFHGHPFAAAGADIFAYDVDGDGDNDVITSLSAHNFGLAWYEQVRDQDAIRFKSHLIMGSKAEENAYGVVFSELHSVALADVDHDGLKDIVTGKTYWSHHTQSPMWGRRGGCLLVQARSKW